MGTSFSHFCYYNTKIVFEGKTLFQYYILVRLLQRKQVVLFSLDGEKLFLFYHDKVYTPEPTSVLSSLQLPRSKPSSSDVFVWSLFDINQRSEPRQLLFNECCFPVQTASPDPIRYKGWVKTRSALVIGLPLWTYDELLQGYVLPISCFCPHLRSQ